MLIDTIDYKIIDGKLNDSEIYSLYEKNISKVMRILVDLIINKNYLLTNYLYDTNSRYKNYLLDINLLINLDDTIMGIKREIELCVGKEIVSFKDGYDELSKIGKIKLLYK